MAEILENKTKAKASKATNKSNASDENNATTSHGVVIEIELDSDPNVDAMMTEYVDGEDNTVGAMVLSANKVEEGTVDWCNSFWAVVMMAARATDIPSYLQSSDEKHELLCYSLQNIYSSTELFFSHYQTMVEELVATESFTTYCKEHNIDVQCTAQHIVYEGKIAYVSVKAYGVEPFYRNLWEKYQEPIYSLN